MYKLGETFIEDADYANKAEYANANNLMIVECGVNEQGAKLYKLEEFTISALEATQEALEDLQYWFDVAYTRKEQKLRRLVTLSKLTDGGSNPRDELLKLYAVAEKNRAEIQRLEQSLQNATNDLA